jgi:membrane-associated phospholipid phosphatase
MEQGRWHPGMLAAINLFSLLLFCSWLFEPTRSLWLALDEAAFWAMNNSLSWGSSWQKTWALANNRAFDLVAGTGMLLLFAHRALITDRKRLPRYIAIGIFMFLTLLVMLQIGKNIPIERMSATGVFPEALRLSELVPDIVTKDYSSDSFPGDHGLVLFLVTGFALFYLPRTHGVIAVIFMVLFAMPRLMSGAHWLTDEIVGAVALGSITLGWLFATPFHHRITGYLEGKILRIWKAA